jgi:uncharacterized membrane protein
MLIHFPSALLPMDAVCYGMSYYTGDDSFLAASFYAMTGGIVLGWLAALFGLTDLAFIPTNENKVMAKALIHGGINLTVILIYTVIAYSAFKTYPALKEAKLNLLIFKTLLIIFMIAGNYLGGSLILKHKIGMEK